MRSRKWLCLALLGLGLNGPAKAGDVTLMFTGVCNNAACTGDGEDNTPPSAVSATLTLSDLTWEALGTGGYEASVSDAFDFGYTGPGSFLNVGSVPLNGEASYFYSATPSIDGIRDFKIVWGESIAGSPGLGFLSGHSTGWHWGGYTLLPVGDVLIPAPYNIHSSTRAGQWVVSSVPEPGGFSLLSLCVGTVAWMARRKAKPAHARA